MRKNVVGTQTNRGLSISGLGCHLVPKPGCQSKTHASWGPEPRGGKAVGSVMRAQGGRDLVKSLQIRACLSSPCLRILHELPV